MGTMVNNLDIMVPNGGASGSSGLLSLPVLVPDSPMDTVIGITDDGTEVGQFTLQDIFAFPPAPSDLTWWVSTLGSDSNPGTFANPFASVQAGFNIAGGYDWLLGVFSPTINVEDGTYVVPAISYLVAPLVNIGVGAGVVNCDPANPGNIIFDGITNLPGQIFFAGDPRCVWQIDGFEGNISGAIFQNNGGDLTCINDTIGNDSLEDHGLYFCNNQGGEFDGGGLGNTYTILANEIAGIIQTQGKGFTNFQNGAFVLQPNTDATDGSFLTSDYSECYIGANSFTNTSTFTSVGCYVYNFGNMHPPLINAFTNPDWPGLPEGTTSGTFVDSTSAIAAYAQAQVQFPFLSGNPNITALPTASQIPPGAWVVVQLSSPGSGMYVVGNNNGTIVSVQLT